ncbi:hypothetical protein COO60DRAFT_1489326, partial [Scenedesmus sp. NREL 46B-D3]
SGCDPNIMTRAQADASQISYRPLKEGELNIMNIEGDDTSCFIGGTEPSSLTCSSTGQGTNEEDTTQQGSGTSSSCTELHCKPQPLDDVHCSMPPPLLETWARVGVDLRQVHADDNDSLLFVTRTGDDSSNFDRSSKPSSAKQQQQPAAPTRHCSGWQQYQAAA